MPEYINHNGSIFQNNEAILMADNMSYRYGYGLFETMKVIKGKIILEDLHFERLFSGFDTLKFNLKSFPASNILKEQIFELVKRNNCEKLARIRLSVSGGNGNLTFKNEKPSYIIEAVPLDKEVLSLNKKGLVIDIYPYARKSCDAFSNLKSANYLPYLMAAKYAKEKNLDDALVLNTNERICDSSNANIFLVKDNALITPPLTEGCVSGTIRRYLISKIQNDQISKYTIREEPLTVTDLNKADEVFLTNAITGIRSVEQFGKKIYSKTVSTYLKSQLLSCMYA